VYASKIELDCVNRVIVYVNYFSSFIGNNVSDNSWIKSGRMDNVSDNRWIKSGRMDNVSDNSWIKSGQMDNVSDNSWIKSGQMEVELIKLLHDG